MSGHHDAHPPTREELVRLISRPVSSRVKQLGLIAAVLGLGIWLVGVFVAPERAWKSWHVNWIFFTVISSAGVTFVAVQRITTARWSRSVIRFMEGYVAWLPVAFVMLLLTVFVGRDHIFPWTHEHIGVPEKEAWLSIPFWTARAIIVYGLITALSVWYIYTSLRLDVGLLPESGASWAKGIRDRMRRGFGEERRELHSTHSLQGRLAVFLALVFGFGWVVLSWDHSMSMDPHFYSTMYGWQFFMTGWVASLMLFALIVRMWRRHLEAEDVIVDNHLHDIGKLCFAFTAFWGYITFSQLLVIWYGNLPEETHWFRNRLIAPWTPLTLSVVFLTFLVPFFGLLGKYPKIYTPTMTLFAISSILGTWIHRYLEIYPPVYVQTVTAPPLGIWEIGTLIGFAGLWTWLYAAFMDAFPKMRVVLMTSPYRDEVQVPVDPKTMEPLPAHE